MNPNLEFLDLHGTVDDGNLSPVLARIRDDIAAGRSFEAVMDVLWESCREPISFDRVGVSFVEEDGQRVVSRYVRTAYDPSAVRLGEAYAAGLANSSLREILDSGRARIIRDLERYAAEHARSASSRLLVAEGVRSSLTLPLRVRDREVGFMFFSSRRVAAFDRGDLETVQALSSALSQTIEKVWLIQRLERSRRDYLQVMGFVSHEMKSPLSSLTTVGRTYLKGYQGPVDPVAGGVIEKMIRISGYMINMVNNYLDLSRLESGEMAFSPRAGLRFREDVLDFALDTVSARAEERGTAVTVEGTDETFRLTGDEDLLRIVAVNLLDNAVKYGEDGGRVRVRLARDGDRMVFSVRNAGVGFSEEQRGKLFKRFSRLKQKGLEDRRGSGLGLYLVWWIVQQHGGDITADSKPGEWAEFKVFLKVDSQDEGGRPTSG